MIKAEFKPVGLQNRRFIVKVSYQDTVGINHVVDTKLDDVSLASLIATYIKPSYTLEIQEVSIKKFPSGYYESFSVDNIISLAHRLRFVEIKIVKEPRVIYVNKVIEKEL